MQGTRGREGVHSMHCIEQVGGRRGLGLSPSVAGAQAGVVAGMKVCVLRVNALCWIQGMCMCDPEVDGVSPGSLVNACTGPCANVCTQHTCPSLQ